MVLAGVVFALPDVLPKPWQDTFSAYTGLRPMTRGLDLQGGTGQISGNFTAEDANNLVIALRSGALPARLVYIDAANESAGSAPAKGSDL